MNRRGIALLATLWLLAMLSVVVASAVTLARIERGAAVNRIALARGRWAAEACLALAEAKAVHDSVVEGVDSTDLGGGLWCRATIEDPGIAIGLEIANGANLAALVGEPDRAAALLDWLDPDDVAREGGAESGWYRGNGLRTPRNGPLVSIDELRLVRGFDSATVARLAPFVTTRLGRRINVNAAPLEVLRTLPGLEPSAVDLILQRRERGNPIRDLDDLLAAFPASLRTPATARYAELQGATAFSTDRPLLHLEGHVPEAAIVARTTVEVALLPGRLAILAREEW